MNYCLLKKCTMLTHQIDLLQHLLSNKIFCLLKLEKAISLANVWLPKFYSPTPQKNDCIRCIIKLSSKLNWVSMYHHDSRICFGNFLLYLLFIFTIYANILKTSHCNHCRIIDEHLDWITVNFVLVFDPVLFMKKVNRMWALGQ